MAHDIKLLARLASLCGLMGVAVEFPSLKSDEEALRVLLAMPAGQHMSAPELASASGLVRNAVYTALRRLQGAGMVRCVREARRGPDGWPALYEVTIEGVMELGAWRRFAWRLHEEFGVEREAQDAGGA